MKNEWYFICKTVSLCQFWLKLDLCYLPFGKDMTIHWNKLESSIPKDVFGQVWLKLANFINVIFAISILAPLGKGCGSSFNKLESSSSSDAFCNVCWIGPVVLEKKMYFCYFNIIFPLKRVRPFIWIYLIPFTQWCFVPDLIEIGPVVLEKKSKMWIV